MQEEATYTAALRTGQVDMLTIGGGITLSHLRSSECCPEDQPRDTGIPALRSRKPGLGA